jgi:hypothetical protein
VAKALAYEFVTIDGRWLGAQTLSRGRRRVWNVGDSVVTEGPRGTFRRWAVVDVEGLRVVFAPVEKT